MPLPRSVVQAAVTNFGGFSDEKIPGNGLIYLEARPLKAFGLDQHSTNSWADGVLPLR